MTVPRRVALSCALLSTLLVRPIAAAAAGGQVVFVVRHAERADAGGQGMAASDPALSAVGKSRAARLASMLRAAGLKRIYTTEFERTRQTAEPLAVELHLDLISMPAADVDGLSRRLDEDRRTSLVVGHSNTVPDILKRLGVTEGVTLSDNDYDDLFIVVRDGAGSTLVRLKY